MINSIIFKVTTFVVVTLLFTIILALTQEALRIDYMYIILPQWGPGITALILGFTLYKNTINKSIRFRGLRPERLLLCLLLPFGVISASYLFGKILGLTPLSIGELHLSFLYITIPSSFLGAVGEVLGWRCFLQSSLEDRLNYISAAVITGILWGLWHVGHYPNGFIYMAFFLVFTISSSIILAFLIRKFDYNLLLAALFHLSINIGFFVFYRESTNDANMMLVNALVWLGGAILILAPSLKGLKWRREPTRAHPGH